MTVKAATESSRPSAGASLAAGRVFDIQRFSTEDGPGIRTTVFLKGCPLRCAWCHNPEGLSAQPSISYSPGKCIDCGECVAVCATGSHRIEKGQSGSSPSHTYSRENCESCGRCTKSCPTHALELLGRELTVEEVLAEVLEDRAFYPHSGGGLTLSGGEPLAQVDFAIALLDAARKEGLHCCVETSGFATWSRFSRLLPVVDLFLYDYKETDPARHREYTGQSNEIILENLHALHDSGAAIELDCPIVPGFNDREDHLAGIIGLARSLPRLRGVRLLPYHPLGRDKLKRLGLPPLTPEPGAVGAAKIASWIGRLRGHGVQVLNVANRERWP